MTDTDTAVDPFLWLEEVDGERALDFVRARNARTLEGLESQASFVPIRDAVREVLDSQDRIPQVEKLGEHLYNFWQDRANPRGVWRRTTWQQFRAPVTSWEIVLDLDALAREEGENWVWKGAQCLPPAYERCLVTLSRGGGDAAVVREFDLRSREFLPEGFNLPEAKSQIEWRDLDTVYVATDFGPGSLTDSGYARIVKRWQRGTPLADAVTVFEGQRGDVSAGGLGRSRPANVPGWVCPPDRLLPERDLARAWRLLGQARSAGRRGARAGGPLACGPSAQPLCDRAATVSGGHTDRGGAVRFSRRSTELRGTVRSVASDCVAGLDGDAQHARPRHPRKRPQPAHAPDPWPGWLGARGHHSAGAGFSDHRGGRSPAVRRSLDHLPGLPDAADAAVVRAGSTTRAPSGPCRHSSMPRA